ncbi:hypothetical protein RF11_15996 [Thelohanellus kitauei]|uniref:Uncharacterized protein n=1 Tax=Thelohanellus kitauei TaxID=669202 RepID=A0A0C2MY33_THEKT|nr:hypothetical protein RF11_15996 [Thelohanellus kitauei]
MNVFRTFRCFDSTLAKRQRYRPNYRIQRFSNLIKDLCVLLVKHEKVVTTVGRAHLLKTYGSLKRTTSRSLYSKKWLYFKPERSSEETNKFISESRKKETEIISTGRVPS